MESSLKREFKKGLTLENVGHVQYLLSLYTKWYFTSNTVFDLLVPRVTPARVNGGGGGRSELVITWEVNMYSHTLDFYLYVFLFMCYIQIHDLNRFK